MEEGDEDGYLSRSAADGLAAHTTCAGLEPAQEGSISIHEPLYRLVEEVIHPRAQVAHYADATLDQVRRAQHAVHLPH